MKNLIILFTLFTLPTFAQTVVKASDFTKSYNTVPRDTAVIFKAAGYGDYTVKIPTSGRYTFTMNILNDLGSPTIGYIWSTATNTWTSGAIALSPKYQTVTVKSVLNTSASYVRLYFADAVTLSSFSYQLDSAFTPQVDLAPVLSRLSALEQQVQALTSKSAATQKALDSLPVIYVREGHGTQTNPL